MLNYIGRGHSTTALLNGSLDDFNVYNYALSADEIARLYQGTASQVPIAPVSEKNKHISLWPVPARNAVYIRPDNGQPISGKLSLLDQQGRVVKNLTVSRQKKSPCMWATCRPVCTCCN
jgi:hypothetical protein